MKKRIIASILTVIMLMTVLQTAALAADVEGTEAVASTPPPQPPFILTSNMVQIAMTD